jgi:hypothetical protein
MINLTTIRHDPGRIVYVFDTPERHTKPVSVLLLGNDEQHLISGGWDNQVKVGHKYDQALDLVLILLLSLYFVR